MLMVHSAMAAMTGAGFGGPVVGQRLFTASGEFVVPAGVTSINAVCIGPGGLAITGGFFTAESGAGGGLSFRNSIPVSEGEVLSVQVTQPLSRILRDTAVLLSANGAGIYGHANFGAADTGSGQWTGYAGSPGAAARDYGDPEALAGSWLGGGGAAKYIGNGSYNSGGSSPYGSASLTGLSGEGQAIGPFDLDGNSSGVGSGSLGAVRIIWGEGRAFPNTNTGDI